MKYYFVLSISVLVKRMSHMCDEFHLKSKGGQKNQKTEPNQSKKNWTITNNSRTELK